MSGCSKTLCLKTLCLSIAALAAVFAFTADWSVSQEKNPAPKPAPSKRSPTAEEAILKALDQPTEISFDQTPLSEVMRILQNKHKINIVANYRALEDAGVVAKDRIVVLEVNTLPGFTSTSLVPRSASAHGWSFQVLVDWMVRDAIKIEEAPRSR